MSGIGKGIVMGVAVSVLVVLVWVVTAAVDSTAAHAALVVVAMFAGWGVADFVNEWTGR